MEITPGKIVALCLVIIYAIVALIAGGLAAIPGIAILLLPSLALIWFAEFLSEMTGYVGRGATIDQTSPELLVAALGWLVLIGIPIYLYLSG